MGQRLQRKQIDANKPHNSCIISLWCLHHRAPLSLSAFEIRRARVLLFNDHRLGGGQSRGSIIKQRKTKIVPPQTPPPRHRNVNVFDAIAVADDRAVSGSMCGFYSLGGMKLVDNFIPLVRTPT